MKAKFQIPRALHEDCGGNSEVMLVGETIGELLEDVRKNYPSLYIRICDETGKLRPHINLFVNNDLLLERKDFKTRVKFGDVVSVFQAVSGG